MTTREGQFRFGFEAMATEFSIVLEPPGGDEEYAAGVAEAIRREICRLEDELSRFRPGSDVWRLAHLSAGESMRVGLAAWDCLTLAKVIYEETQGAFDITVGPLMRLWKSREEATQEPDLAEIEEVGRKVGSHLFELNPDTLEVTVLSAGMVFDLGAVGKGYALDQAVNVLEDYGIQAALLNAGDSTVLGVGCPADADGWQVTLHHPVEPRVWLRDEAVSGTGFAAQGAHVMNPRTLRPVPIREQRQYAMAPTAAMADALSTAAMVMDPSEAREWSARYPQVRIF